MHSSIITIFLSAATIAASSLSLPLTAPVQVYTLPFKVSTGDAPLPQTIASSTPLDNVYVQKPNASSYEWWYFDAVASDASASVVFQPGVFYYADPDAPLQLLLSISHSNDTLLNLQLPYDEMRFATVGQGSSGAATDGSFAWSSTPDLSDYVITLNLKEEGITGEIILQSTAPPHVACGPATVGASLDFHWDLYWANTVPDSMATVNLKINGTEISFQGSGYHDKNWSGYSFIPYLNQWYWGHGRTSEYSLVWFYRLDISGGISSSIYIAETKTGNIIYSDCSGSLNSSSSGNVIVRPYGDGVTYPLGYNSGASVEGLQISVDAGTLGKFAFTTTQKQIVQGSPVQGYERWIGLVRGGKAGETNSSGPALWEQMGPFY